MVADVNDDIEPMQDVSHVEAKKASLRAIPTWTEGLPNNAHTDSFRTSDWSATPLGPLSDWPAALRCHILMLFADTRPACILWGEDRIVIYNELFTPFCGRDYSDLLGKSLKTAFKDHAAEIETLLRKAAATRRAVDVPDQPNFMHCTDGPEATAFTVQYLPLFGDSGSIEGFYNTAVETSNEKLKSERLFEAFADESESRLQLMAQHAPLGMCQTTPDNQLAWANEQFYEIFEHDRTNTEIFSVLDKLSARDRETATKDLEAMMKGGPRIVREFQLQRSWKSAEVKDDDEGATSTWILTSSFPLMEDGKVKLVMGYFTDISHQKWAESVQSRNAEAATQAKRRQEEFIDTTSHEMRNPLTAITQLADGIRACLDEDVEDTKEGYRAVIENNVDAATTIIACGAHQRRVIDDVLTLSRLESNMFTISPVAGRPIDVVNNTIKMFSTESAMEDIDMEALEDHSYHNADINYVLLDPARLTQVLINMISNAVKFTSSQPTRRISIVYGAQKYRPPKIRTIFGALDWIGAQDTQRVNLALGTPASGSEKLYLYFCVQDTGRGMTEEEQEKLFQRFSQARPKTDIAYGGSGLGLYICRQLSEKQGGGVGCASRSGEGSVFGFYIQTTTAKDTDLSAEQRRASPVQRAKPVNTRPNLPQRSSSAPPDPKPVSRMTSEDHSRTIQTPTDTAMAEGIKEKNGPSREEDDQELETADMLASPPVDGNKQLEAHAEKAPAAEEFPKEKQSQHRNNFHILLVEDNLVNQKILAKQLRKAKCTVTVANHGEEALKILENTDCWQSRSDDTEASKIDVVLMDWEMPVMDGLTCTRKIRELEKECQIIRRLDIIGTTANVRQEQQDKAMEAGMDSVMSKPFTVGELLQRIRETLPAERGRQAS
ncbi:putative histidine kinase 1 [Pseudocercospora fuligena]|uniref:Putative histidine kinase 1 n=1 Tax=Pseudocercospora fuligena TaxID=685502 RepID=A0A8H6VMW4_9PEZI|nr:putative histidine kinase 1 [Pseudocercospora fuligena]